MYGRDQIGVAGVSKFALLQWYICKYLKHLLSQLGWYIGDFLGNFLMNLPIFSNAVFGLRAKGHIGKVTWASILTHISDNSGLKSILVSSRLEVTQNLIGSVCL